jgi:hypothetical protein
VARFAGYAAQPGAYMYEARRDDALRDTCAAFDVVVRLDVLEALGRRLAAEVALLDGTRTSGGELRAHLIPLARAEVGPAGDVRWHTLAHADDGRLVWSGGQDHTPVQLRERLERARAQEAARAGTTIAAAQSALERAERLLGAGEAERALGALRAAWGERHDDRLLGLARRALERWPEHFAALHKRAQECHAELERLIAGCRWPEAHQAYSEIIADIGLAAAAAPLAGWAAIAERVRQGLADQATVAQICASAELALRRGDPRAALDLVNDVSLPGATLSPESALALLRVREAALVALLSRGEASPDSVRVVRERRLAYEQAGDKVSGPPIRSTCGRDAGAPTD